MNPPPATDVLSINGLAGRFVRTADAAAMGLAGPPAVPYGGQNNIQHCRHESVINVVVNVPVLRVFFWRWPCVNPLSVE